MIASAELTRERMLAAAVTAVQPGRVYLATRMRQPFERTASPVLLDLGLAHPCVMEALASSHSSANTCRTSELLGAVKTLLAIATADRNRSYVLAAAMTSESGKSIASISDTLPSNAFVRFSSIVLDSLDVVELGFSIKLELAPLDEEDRLFAAAQKLLDAAQAAEAVLGRQKWLVGSTDPEAVALFKLRAAIAKATGSAS